MAGEVLVGYDGQDGSKAALAAAIRVAAAFQRSLVVVFGYQPSPIGGETRDLRESVRSVGEEITAEAVAHAGQLDPSVTVEAELVDDRPAEALLRAAEEHDALMIVVGAAARGPVAGALLGSVTYNIVHRSTYPVLVVPAPHAG